MKHHLDKGSLHLYIVSTKVIEKNQEILLPPETKNGLLPPQLSIKDELRQIKKVNGLLDEKKPRRSTPSLKRRVKREIVKKEQLAAAADSSSEDDMPVSLRKTRSTAEKSVNFDLNTIGGMMEGGEERNRRQRVDEDETVESKWGNARVKVEEPCLPPPPALELKVEPKVEEEEEDKETVNVEDEKDASERQSACMERKPTHELKIEIKEAIPEAKAQKEATDQEAKVGQLSKGKEKSSVSAAASEKSPELPPLSSPAAAKSPGKPALGLPDQSGLIVGVNTINYDASLRNKSKTREEKKMEMILKAIEAMERAEARKRSDPNGTGGCGESFSERSVTAKRRRSSSAKKENVDSAVEASSADEGGPAESKNERAHKGRRRRQPTLRRRSRAKSGDSTSAMSADEGGGGEGTPLVEESEAASTPGEMQPFKFPRHKKQLASESFNPDG